LTVSFVAARQAFVDLARVVAKEDAKKQYPRQPRLPQFCSHTTDKQIPEQAKELGITEEVIKNVMLKETVDAEFTTVQDDAQTALFLAAFGTNALTGQSITVSHGWHMQ
jgi:3-hydroxybutyrate dehydrogenase